MKFIVKKNSIEEAVKNLCRVINSKSMLPILGDVLCKVNAKDKEMEMIASDSEIWLTYTVVLEEVEGEGQFCVGANNLMDALSQLSDQPLTVSIDYDANTFNLEHSTGVTYFPIENADEYPVPLDMKVDVTGEIDAHELAIGLTSVLFATATDELRPQMTGVHLEVKDDQIDIVASNGHVLMRYRIRMAGMFNCAFTLPKKVAKMLPQMLIWDDDDIADILWNDTQCCIEQENWQLAFRLIEGNYPNYESVIPKDSPYDCIADRGLLMNSIRKVSPFSNESSNLIRCLFEQTAMTIFAEDEDFAAGANDRLDVSCNVSDPMEIGFKASTVISILQKMPYNQVVIHLTSPDRAAVIEEQPKEVEKEKPLGHLLGLAMPMILNKSDD